MTTRKNLTLRLKQNVEAVLSPLTVTFSFGSQMDAEQFFAAFEEAAALKTALIVRMNGLVEGD